MGLVLLLPNACIFEACDLERPFNRAELRHNRLPIAHRAVEEIAHLASVKARCMITREQIVAAARSWIGTPYHHQASVKGVGWRLPRADPRIVAGAVRS